jgi:hypothetical protein
MPAATYSHAQQTRRIVFLDEIFVCERARTINSRATRSIAMEKIAALNHEVFDLEERSLVGFST